MLRAATGSSSVLQQQLEAATGKTPVAQGAAEEVARSSVVYVEAAARNRNYPHPVVSTSQGPQKKYCAPAAAVYARQITAAAAVEAA